MAQRNADVFVEGNVVKSERKNGSMPNPDNPNGPAIVWDYIEARVLTPAYDAVDVRFPSDGSIPLPKRDELVRLNCEARSAGGNLRLTVKAVETALLPA
ncbi:hypothetical protein [Cellulomonas olei]|uniref:hypothetical protein n=1 Tax=Cellulomonas sp. P4 TaxID=3142533 RepID=UPI0031B9E86F